MKRDLQTILLIDNPWLDDPAKLDLFLWQHVPERYLSRQMADGAGQRWRDARRAHLVIGPRQAGKSTMLRHHLAELGQPYLFVDCEQALVQQWCRSAPLVWKDLGDMVSRPVPLLFDEVQHLDEAGLFVKGLVDRKPGAPIFVTGSSSYHLGAGTRESLAGRATRTRLLPFSLDEVCLDLASRPRMLREREREQRFMRQLVVGGYPDAWLASDPAPMLLELVEAFVLRDVSDRFRIGRPDAFRRMIELLARQVGSLVNMAEWATLLGLDRATVQSYLSILEETHVVVTLRPFAGGRRSELTRNPKLYFVDNGIRNHLVGDLRPFDQRLDRGAVLESWVFSELYKLLPREASLHFWRSTSKAEVDFVLRRGERLIAVEVKASAASKHRLTRGSRSFLGAYRPRRFFVAQLGEPSESEVDGVPISFCRACDLPELVRQALAE